VVVCRSILAAGGGADIAKGVRRWGGEGRGVKLE
jgi:hypothetical protein